MDFITAGCAEAGAENWLIDNVNHLWVLTLEDCEMK